MLTAEPGLTSVTKPVIAGGHACLEATLTSAPDRQQAYTTIGRTRATLGAIPGADALVGGTTASKLGFTVAFGVLLDTIVVRSVLVTALNLDLGRHVWWPGRLARSQPAVTGAPRLDGYAPAAGGRPET